MTYTPIRRGTILLWCLAFSAFLTTMAFAFVRTSHQHLEATSGSIIGMLARHAATSGTSHAIAVICDDYTGAPATPSNRFSPWMTAFAPFNLRLDNLTEQAIGFSGDLGESDVKASVPLALPYFVWQNYGQFQRWDAGFNGQGDRLHSGYSRWIEPGSYGHSQFYAHNWVPDTNLVPNPDSRRFDAPAAASAYPDAPLWFDQRWRPVRSRAEAAYRLRYACLVEDLSGHLLWNAGQASYPAPASMKILTGPGEPGYVNELNSEYNGALALNYAMPFFNLAEIAGRSIGDGAAADGVNTYAKLSKTTSWMTTFLGLGGRAGNNANNTFMWYYVPNPSTSGLIYQSGCTYNDAMTGGLTTAYDGKYPWAFSKIAPLPVPPGTPAPATLSGAGFVRGNLGAMYSWSNLVGQITILDSTLFQTQAQHAAWLWTPFGSASRNVGTTPARASVNCPWQINPLTAAPRVLMAMILGIPRSNLKKQELKQETLQVNTAFGALTPVWVDVPPGVDLDANTGYPSITFRGADLFVDAFKVNGASIFNFPEKTIDALSNISSTPYVPGTATSNKKAAPFRHFDYYPGPSWWRGGYLDANEIAPPPPPYARLPEDSTTANAEDELGKEFYMVTGGVPSAALTVTALDPMSGVSIPLVPPLGDEMYGTIASAYSDSIKTFAVPNGKTADWYRVKWTSIMDGFPDTFWADITEALAHTLAVTRATWNPSCMASASASVQATLATFDVDGSGKIDSPEEMDRLFLALLGTTFKEATQDPAEPGYTGPTSNIPKALYVDKTSIGAHGVLKEWKQNTNLEILADAQKPTLATSKFAAGDDGAEPDLFVKNTSGASLSRSVARCLLMEKVVNDLRMSFFGANPTYASFKAAKLFSTNRPIDTTVYGVDATVATGYALAAAVTSTTATTSAIATGLKTQARQASYSVDASGAVLNNEYFSLTGYFVFGKSHFYRIITRGEVFSVQRNMAIAETNLETALVVDPNADGDLGDTHVIYQNWHVDNFLGNRPSSFTP